MLGAAMRCGHGSSAPERFRAGTGIVRVDLAMAGWAGGAAIGVLTRIV